MEAHNERPTSVVFDHCVKVYNEMQQQACEEPVDDVTAELPSGTTMLVYEGHLTKLFASLGLSTPYYTSVVRHLKSMGCIEQLRRGGGSSPSRWILHGEPNEDAFNGMEERKRLRQGRSAILEQQLRDNVRTVNDLYAKVDSQGGLLLALVDKVNRLEAKVGKDE